MGCRQAAREASCKGEFNLESISTLGSRNSPEASPPFLKLETLLSRVFFSASLLPRWGGEAAQVPGTFGAGLLPAFQAGAALWAAERNPCQDFA